MTRLCETNIKYFNNNEELRDKFFAHADPKYFENVELLFKDFSINNYEFEYIIEETYRYVKRIHALFQILAVIDYVEEINKEFDTIVERI